MICDTLEIWLYKVFPPLFTIYFISSLLLSTSSINILSFIIKPLKILFNFDTLNALNLFILSFINGVPGIVTLIDSYYQKDLITKEDYLTLIKCTGNISPLFIFSLSDFKTIIYIYLSHILSNILLCIILTRFNFKAKKLNNKNYNKVDKCYIKINFFYQINNFPKIILTIALYMVITTIIIFAFKDFIPIYALIFLDVSSGCISILNNNLPLCLISALLSFNGICIHMQLSTLSNNLKYSTYLIYRIFSTIISLGLYIFVFNH